MDEQTTNQTGYSQQESSYGYEGNPFEQMDQDLCKRCHCRRIDRSENPESILCKDCREELIKLKVPPVIIGVSIGVALIVLISIVMIGAGYAKLILRRSSDSTESNVSEEMQEEETDREEPYGYVEASEVLIQGMVQNVADTGLIVSSMDDMLDSLEENPDPDGMETAIALVDIAMEYSYYDYAAYTIENYLAGKNVSDSVYDRMNSYIEIMNKYYDTYNVVDETWTSYSEMMTALDSEDMEEEDKEEEYLRLIQEFHDEIEVYLDDESYDQAFLYYQLAGACQDDEERIQHLKDCIAIDGNYFDAKAQLGVYYRRQGDLETAREILTDAYERNKEVYSVIRGLATLELTEGNLTEGLDYAKAAYDMYSDGTYVVDTYLIALMANGQMEEAEALIKEWEEKDYVFDDDFYAFQRGEMTLEEYYIGD